jgi:hypothetical protein
MLRRVALVRTDVSEELSASLIRVTRIGELGTTLAVTSNGRTLRRNPNITKDVILHSHRHENLKFYMSVTKYVRCNGSILYDRVATRCFIKYHYTTSVC